MSEQAAPRALREKMPRAGELVALAGAACVVASLMLPWYETLEGSLSAWDTFGAAVVLAMLAAVAAVVLAVTTATERSPALPMAAAVWATLLGAIASVAAIVRVLERPDASTSLCAGAWLALAGAVLILVGAWRSMRDERTHRYPPASPEPRRPPPG